MTSSGPSDAVTIWIPAMVVLVGLVGIVVPVLPGAVLVLAGVLLWALLTGSTGSWIVFGLALVLFVTGTVVQYLLPGRRMKRDGVRTSTLVLAVALGIVGLVVVPVVGAPLGFVLGIYLVELARSRGRVEAWTATRAALRAVLHSMGIELLTGLTITATWVVGVAVVP